MSEEVVGDEANISAKHAKACQDPWFSPANGHPEWPGDPPRAAAQGASAVDGLAMPNQTVGRIRDRRTLARLRRPVGRAASGPIRVSFVPVMPGQGCRLPMVGFAVGRRCGGAVERNRQRRRLRAAVREVAEGLPPGNFLVIAEREIAVLPYRALVEAVG